MPMCRSRNRLSAARRLDVPSSIQRRVSHMRMGRSGIVSARRGRQRRLERRRTEMPVTKP